MGQYVAQITVQVGVALRGYGGSAALSRRFALPHARILMHQGSAGIGGNAVDIELQAQDLRHTRDTVLALIAERTGQPVAAVHEDSLRDRWYSAEQAREYGFVDHVLSSFHQIRPRQHARIGLAGGSR